MTIPRQRGSSGSGHPHLVTPDEEPLDAFPALAGGSAVLLAVATGLAVFLLGSLAVHFRPDGSATAAWWPATGVAVAAIAVVTPQRRLLVALAVGAGALAANLQNDRPWLVVLGFAAANALTPWIWVRLMTRGRDARPRLLTVDDFGWFVVATLASTTIAGLVGALCARVGDGADLLTTWGAFLAAQSASMIVLVPFAMALPPAARKPHPTEVGLQAAALLGTLLVVFGPQQMLPLGILPLPFLVWGAVRLPPRWVTAELLVAGVLMCTLTTMGAGPYAAVTHRGFAPELIGLLLQAALLVYAMVALPLTLLVHRQRAALRAARESYRLLQSVLTGATGTAIIGCNRSGTVTFFNTGAEEMLGYPEQDVVGHVTPLAWFDPAEIQARAAQLGVSPGLGVLTAAVDAGAPSERRDWTMMRRDGTRLVVALRVTPRVSDRGVLLGYLGVGEDVTERRRTEATLRDALDRERQALERMEQLDAAKNTFVSSVSHELRTPMTSVLGYTDMVLGEAAGPVNAEQRGMLEAARRNGNRLLRLIEDLLAVSLIEHGAFSIDIEPVDLRTAAEGAVDAINPLLADRDLDLRVDLGSRELMVLGDLAHLERVVINLLANAVKFTPDGGCIDLRLRAFKQDAVLEVTDTGIGIPTDEQSQLFQRFFRSTTAQELEVPGTGLGLSIVKTIVSSHDGRITVRSRPGEGTSFRVEIPLGQPAAVNVS
jgi:PAS domain S-box-containing protein